MKVSEFMETICTKRIVLLMFSIGFVLIGIGGICFGTLGYVVEYFVAKNLALAEGKETYEKWEVTPVPVYFQVFLFNVTNPVEVEHHGKKPILQEVGPYIYKQTRRKNVLAWDIENDTVTYEDIKTYVFIQKGSRDLDNVIYTLNVPILGMSQSIRKLGYWVQSLAASALDDLLQQYGESLFINKTARTLLFEGYKVEIIEDLIGLVKSFVTVPEVLPNNTFGFLYGKNNSGDGIFTVKTGLHDFNDYTHIVNWNNNSRLTWWKDQYCDMLNGTDGAQFPPPVTKNDVLYVYVAELCRSIYLEFVEEVYVKGIKAYRFTTPTRLFDTPFQNPDNKCYCTKKDLCGLSGILDISSCRKGIPLAISGPHFYKAHPNISAQVDGLKPDDERHATYVDIEPMTGVVLRASRKLQMNYALDNYPHLRMTRYVQSAIYPLLWIIEGAEVDEEIAKVFTAKVKTPLTVAKSVLTACIVLGILWIATALVVTIYILIKQQKAAKNTIKAQYKAVSQKAEDIIPKNEKSIRT